MSVFSMGRTMVHDPTGWPSPIHGFVHWYRQSNEYEREVYEIALAYYQRYGHGRLTDLKMRGDADYQLAISNQQFAERRAATYGHAATIRFLEASIAETRRLSELLARFLATEGEAS